MWRKVGRRRNRKMDKLGDTSPVPLAPQRQSKSIGSEPQLREVLKVLKFNSPHPSKMQPGG